jgi:antitoxin component YwqK of YwqJK toxin-antitoxin module
MRGNYKSGQRDSLWTHWYDNGVIASKYFYDNKTVDGKVMEWHIDKECWDRMGNACECGEHWWSDCELH